MSRIHDAMRRATFSSDVRARGRRPYLWDGLPLDEGSVTGNKEKPIFVCGGEAVPADEQTSSTLNTTAPSRNEVVKLVQRLFILPDSNSPRVVVFATVDNGNSSFEISRCAAEILGPQVPGSVCLVQADLRNNVASEKTGSSVPGVTDAIVTAEPIQQFLTQGADKSFWTMPVGSRVLDNTPALFASDRWRQRMLELRDEFDYILIDAPPIASYVDAILLGQKADGVILVIEAHSTRRESARKAKESLESSNVKLLGAILNNRTFPVPASLYHKL